MKNIIDIDGHKAVVSFDPEIKMLRGDFLDLTGGADFYAKDTEQLEKEGRTSLRVYLEACEKQGTEPYKKFSGKFNVRLEPELHQAAVVAASAEGVSLNEWIADRVREAAEAA